ncbi:hypothetical protein PV10_08108 [Exophiala mesophila]|uniref:ATP-dependent DNA helicase II subunit 2 n=1 Tax=Exophiala mesophila TaxID=212818 RepID=A0A0D1Z0T6_EXOME|nr:uncharacterized protein PV10_08108 [Exophiala mesophila]KIV88422.1 hypothetical protein PV10_08108 [Exophiala mesophila]
MADKEATVYVIDVAHSMGRQSPNRTQSDLEWSLQYVWDKITNTVFTGRKTLHIGIVALGTDATSLSDDLQNEDAYQHISVVQPLDQILMPQLRSLPPKLQPSSTDERDVLSGIIVGVDMILKHCRNLKYKKKVVVVTNGSGQIDDDDVETTADQFKQHGIELVVLGVDFDDTEYGFKEEDKPEQKVWNEALLKRLCEATDGVYGTMQQAIDELAIPNIKPVRPTPTFTGQLRLGNPEIYDSALSIDVQRYFKTSIRRPPTASAFVVRQGGGGSGGQDEAGTLDTVHSTYRYTVQDPENESGVRDVDREDLAKGYEYGRTAVAISETEQNITRLETSAAYEILGFIPIENVERYMLLDNSNMLVAQKGNDKATLALSSLIHALHELGSVAVARLVKKDMNEPILTILSPLATQEIECLVENVLPFAEDVRTYRFPPLDKVLTVSGKALTEHRNLPNDDLLNSMSEFVDSMNLIDDQGEELMAIEDTFSPLLHIIEGAVKHRAVHPTSPIPEKPESFLAYSRQPAHLQEASQSILARLIKAADVKKVPPKTKGRRRYREAEKPLSGLNVEELFEKEDRTSISATNAIPEFKQLVGTTTKLEDFQKYVQQMLAIIQDWTRDSLGDQNYGRVLEALGVMREEMIGYEEPKVYNDAIAKLKHKLSAKDLGGDRRELWWKIRVSKLGVISQDVSESSDLTREEADKFMAAKL